MKLLNDTLMEALGAVKGKVQQPAFALAGMEDIEMAEMYSCGSSCSDICESEADVICDCDGSIWR